MLIIVPDAGPLAVLLDLHIGHVGVLEDVLEHVLPAILGANELRIDMAVKAQGEVFDVCNNVGVGEDGMRSARDRLLIGALASLSRHIAAVIGVGIGVEDGALTVGFWKMFLANRRKTGIPIGLGLRELAIGSRC